MGLQKVKIDNFRCLESVEFAPDARINLITGENGAGKTSILEALFFLSRGRSFRPGQAQGLIRAEAEEFTVFCELADTETRRLGVRFSRADGRSIHFDGGVGAQIADSSAAFPVQVIDPEVHHLVQGGPQGRRQFLDWGVFHVKHSFFESWRRFRRALQQRNTALRQKADESVVQVWDSELLQAGQLIDIDRREYLEEFEPFLTRISLALLGTSVLCRYSPGWPAGGGFENALAKSLTRDRLYGMTHVGPHRAELVLEVDGTPARHHLSRGQQKLLGTALLLAQSEFVAARMDRHVTLLVDELAAELDAGHLESLIRALEKPGLQLFFTALREDVLPFAKEPALFHVKHGVLSTLI